MSYSEWVKRKENKKFMELPFIEFWYQHLESDYYKKLDELERKSKNGKCNKRKCKK